MSNEVAPSPVKAEATHLKSDFEAAAEGRMNYSKVFSEIMADQKKFQGSAYQDLLHDLSSQLVSDKVLPGIEIVGIEKQTNGRLDMVIKEKDQSLVRLDDSKSLEQIPANQTDAILKQFAPIEIAQKDAQATAPQTEAQLRTGNSSTDGPQPQKVEANQTYVPIEPVLKPRENEAPVKKPIEGGTEAEQVEWENFHQRLNKEIHKKWDQLMAGHTFPAGLNCHMEMTINKNGSAEFRWNPGSGNKQFDEAAIKAMSETLRFHPELLKFPPQSQRPQYVNTIDFNTGGNENSVPVPSEVVK